MLETKKSQIINATSSVMENGVKVNVASMYASLDDSGNRNENCAIINQELYSKNYATVEADIAEFKKMASEMKN